MNYNTAPETNRARNAKGRLESQFLIGKERERRLIELVSNMVITDALVRPSVMAFGWHEKDLIVALQQSGDTMTVHPHALGQMSQVFEYPKIYVNKLVKGCAGIPRSKTVLKLVDDLNWHAHESKLKDRKGNSAKYLCRYVDGEIRGFLSRSFKRHLASKPLLRAFVTSCAQAGLKAVDAHASPVRVNLQCVLPHVFEPYDGEYVTIGVAWSNSDFGGGRMKVSMFMRRVNGPASAILNDAISEVHIGPIIEESDIEMSEDTNRAELEAQRKAIRDAVVGQVKPEQVNKLLVAIKLAQEEELPWHRLKSELSRVLQKKELASVYEALTNSQTDNFEELPPVRFDDEDDPVATRWWAAAVLGQLAEKELDAERKKAMQEMAGETIGKAKGLKK